jgi:hypothetical protein
MSPEGTRRRSPSVWWAVVAVVAAAALWATVAMAASGSSPNADPGRSLRHAKASAAALLSLRA